MAIDFTMGIWRGLSWQEWKSEWENGREEGKENRRKEADRNKQEFAAVLVPLKKYPKTEIKEISDLAISRSHTTIQN